MTRNCFFVAEIAQKTGDFELPRDLSRQLESVLRAKPGDSIELLDGHGSAWECQVTAIRRGIVTVSVLGKVDRPACEPVLPLTLAVGIARPDTMDLIVRQATEMGVSRLALFRAVRSQYGLSGDLAEKKRERWLRIACEAVCQCGRRVPPQIFFFEDLADFLTSLDEDQRGGALKIFALEREPGAGLRSLAERNDGSTILRIVAALGPEGGWDKSESSALTLAGFLPVSLGPRTLRMETAAVALISFLQLLWGDMGEGLSRP
ncbi:MAG: RsmE family RNA methyltransferase [Syntrophobacteraceae bacterium]|nr:RsmE family RNA methyltransferase [Syntrophobacteraceae bacterium]